MLFMDPLKRAILSCCVVTLIAGCQTAVQIAEFSNNTILAFT